MNPTMNSPGQRRFILLQPQTPVGLRQRVVRYRDEASTPQTTLNLNPGTFHDILTFPHVQRAAMDLFTNFGLSSFEQQQQQNQQHPPYIFPFNSSQQLPASNPTQFKAGNVANIHPAIPTHSSFNSRLSHTPTPAHPASLPSAPSPSTSLALIQRETGTRKPSSHALVTVGSREVIPTSTSALVPTWHGSLQTIQVETHNARIEQQKEQDSSKGTGPAYERHIQNYSAWWDTEQSRRQQVKQDFVPIPALPPTVTKVALWLQQGEATRCKVCGSRLTKMYIF